VSERGWLRLILGLYLLLALGYSLLLPMWEAPDETAHFLYVLIVARERRLPTPDETYEYGQPPTYYLLAGGTIALLDRLNPALADPYRPPLVPWRWAERYDWRADNYRPLWGPLLLRWLNISLGLGTLLFIYQATRRIVGGWRLLAGEAGSPAPAVALATTALAGLTPQFLHVSAAVSNDPLAFLVGAALIDGLSHVAMTTPKPGRLALIAGAALFAPFFVKLTLTPVSLALLAGLAWQGRRWRLAVSRTTVATALGCLALGAGLVAANPALAQQLGADVLWRLFHVLPELPPNWPLRRILAFYVTSYWGQVSYGIIGLARPLVLALTMVTAVGWLGSLRLLIHRMSLGRYWAIVAAVTVAGAAGLALAAQWQPWLRLAPLSLALVALALLTSWWRQTRHDPARRWAAPPLAWAFIWLAAGLALLTVLKNSLTTVQYHGRFLFPTLGPLSLLTVGGLYASLPGRPNRWLPPVVIVAMVGVNLHYWLSQIIPLYFQPWWD
jgi:hypothetical protein